MSLMSMRRDVRRPDPMEPGAAALMVFSLVALSGFAVGWLFQSGAF